MGVQPFMFATGIENSYPTIARPDGTTTRVDEMERCSHYRRWREDFAITKQLGIDYLRYGPPYYSTHPAPGTYDWEFSDETFAELRGVRARLRAAFCARAFLHADQRNLHRRAVLRG